MDKVKPISKLVNNLNELTFQKTNVLNNFIEHLKSKYTFVKISRALNNWHDLTFGDFLKELKKAKIQLSLSEEAEWMAYFNEQKQKALALKTEIDNTDKQIDQMVYELYGLTEEEIAIIEESSK
jgi:hypothetical protein